jgi:SPP1 gp7 family putative phage head morphogenesis protein
VLASIVANGMAAGKSQRDIANEILPQVDGVRSSARRIARTEGARVLHQTQQLCHEQLGDLIVAYQVHSVHDHNTRPWHAARSGTVYYRDPKPGQKGPAQQPNPPAEAEDAGERPSNTPATAPNCRCWLSPVLSAPQHILNDPAKMAVFTTNAEKVVPDPASYADWFQRTDTRRQKIAVGSRKHDWATKEFGKGFGWEVFITPEGKALTLKALKAESDKRRGERIAKVRATLIKRKELIQQTSTYGFLLPAG